MLKPSYMLPPHVDDASEVVNLAVTVVGLVSAEGGEGRPPRKSKRLHFVRCRVLRPYAKTLEADTPSFRMRRPFVDAKLVLT